MRKLLELGGELKLLDQAEEDLVHQALASMTKHSNTYRGHCCRPPASDQSQSAPDSGDIEDLARVLARARHRFEMEAQLWADYGMKRRNDLDPIRDALARRLLVALNALVISCKPDIHASVCPEHGEMKNEVMSSEVTQQKSPEAPHTWSCVYGAPESAGALAKVMGLLHELALAGFLVGVQGQTLTVHAAFEITCRALRAEATRKARIPKSHLGKPGEPNPGDDDQPARRGSRGAAAAAMACGLVVSKAGRGGTLERWLREDLEAQKSLAEAAARRVRERLETA